MQSLDEELLKLVVCPRDKQDHIEGTRALAAVKEDDPAKPPELQLKPGEIDPFVKDVIGATNGSLYQHLVGTLTEYPIPALRLPPAKGQSFLEIGCNWGRWCLAAAQSGYRAVGIDPSLKGIRAARRVAQQLGVRIPYLVADGRYLPFRDSVFDQVFSYSVLQHLSKENTRSVLAEIHRVLCQGGQSLIQMPNVFGIRCLYHQFRRGFRETRDFEVRYWTIPELHRTFEATLGPASIAVDGFFSLNPQVSDLRFFPWHYKLLVLLSDRLQRLSTQVPALAYLADSLYVSASRSDLMNRL
jgi:SAM-dependent methyltransferase